MTIILAIPTKDGVILASDGQITAGDIRARGKKIKPLNKHCIWGAAGREALIQRVEEKINNFSEKEQPLGQLKDNLGLMIRDCNLELFGIDRQPSQEEFVFVECMDKPCILHLTTSGTPEWIRTGSFGIGIGRPFVFALLQKYSDLIPKKLDVKKAALLAYKVIEEAIEVGAYGLGEPIDVWQISKSGTKNYNVAEREKLKRACERLRASEITVLLNRIY